MTAGPFEASWQIPLLSHWPLQKYFQLMGFRCELLMWGRFCHQQNHPQKNRSWSSTPPKFETPVLLERVMLVQWIWSKKTVPVQIHCQSIFLTKFLNLKMLLVWWSFCGLPFCGWKKHSVFFRCASLFSLSEISFQKLRCTIISSFWQTNIVDLNFIFRRENRTCRNPLIGQVGG